MISRVTNDIDNITQTLLQTLNNVLASVFMIIGILGMMFWLSWSLALFSLIVFPLGMYALVKILRKSKPEFRAQWKMTGEVSAIVEESFAGHDVVSAYGLEDDFAAVFDKSNQKLFAAGFKGHFYSQLAMPIMGFISNLSFVIIAVFGGYLALSGRMSIGAIQAFIHYSKQLNSPISTIAQVANLIQSGAASSERIFEFLDSDEMEADLLAVNSSNTATIKAAQVENNVSDPHSNAMQKGAISFKNVNFSYESGKPVIKNLSLMVEPGQQIAIVGPTGAGKLHSSIYYCVSTKLMLGRFSLMVLILAQWRRAICALIWGSSYRIPGFLKARFARI
ncbi:ABC transporter transmembrane domain-containing protein [Arcanobacterium hippocoleae]|uniref:ABC transporter transmembrane domain-containing protein n=1 Tax=Arcanobacterium hippocoleae TaxID=149017 RepID=UPI00333F2D3E